MRLTIQHETIYRYQDAPKHLIQLLRLTPRAEAHQRVLDWRLTASGKLTAFTDSYGNHSHSHVLNSPGTQLKLMVYGVVEITALKNGVLPHESHHQTLHLPPPLSYLIPTPLTETSVAIKNLAQAALPSGLKQPMDALQLVAAILQAVPYHSGDTDVTSSAAQAFDLKNGVCQDHAHIMIAACRYLNVPARYVSGYVDPGNSHAAASHAWVDVYVNQQWVSVDVTNGIFASDVHCRLAVGRDYLDAGPVRGVRAGGQTEQLDVRVTVDAQQ